MLSKKNKDVNFISRASVAKNRCAYEAIFMLTFLPK